MGAKQLEMLLATVPSAMLIGFLSNTGYPYEHTQIEELEAAAHTFGRKIFTRSTANEGEIKAAFDAFSQQGFRRLLSAAILFKRQASKDLSCRNRVRLGCEF
jgi:hypothetical protein